MPTYKYDSASDSEEDIQRQEVESEEENDEEPGPDDTFHFRTSFSRRNHAVNKHDTSFQTNDTVDDRAEEEDEDLYSEHMEAEEDEGDLFSEEPEDDESLSMEESELEHDMEDPFAAAVRIEKRPTWVEQIEYTDRAIKRLKAIDQRERLINSKIHWGGQLPELKYSPEDME